MWWCSKPLHERLIVFEVAALAVCATAVFLSYLFVITYHELQIIWTLVF